MTMKRRTWRNLGLLAVSTILSILVGEIVLRVAFPLPVGHFIHAPLTETVFAPHPGVMPGIQGESTFRTNSVGIRGSELGSEDSYRVLALGGSTTECLYLDQDEQWPGVLQKLLREASAGAWVGNGGSSGHALPHNVIQMSYLLDRLPDIDTVVLMAGLNDFLRSIGRKRPLSVEKLSLADAQTRVDLMHWGLRRGPFQISPPADDSGAWSRTGYGRVFARVAAADAGMEQVSQDAAGKMYQDWRRWRRDAKVMLDEVPDLAVPLDEFRHHLRVAAEIAKLAGVRLLLVTQTSQWKAEMSEEAQALLWLGHVEPRGKVPPKTYYSPVALAAGLDAFNQALIKFAAEEGFEIVDIEPTMAGHSEFFYDDVHFNERGAAEVARCVAEPLLRWLSR